jgi:hypothetical protein
MASQNQNAIDPIHESLQDYDRINPTGTHNTNNSQIRRILDARDAGQIGSGVAAPVAQEAYKFWVEFRHSRSLMLDSGYSILDRQTYTLPLLSSI